MCHSEAKRKEDDLPVEFLETVRDMGARLNDLIAKEDRRLAEEQARDAADQRALKDHHYAITGKAWTDMRDALTEAGVPEGSPVYDAIRDYVRALIEQDRDGIDPICE